MRFFRKVEDKMKRYLKIPVNIILYLFTYLISQCICGFFLGLAFLVVYGPSMSKDKFHNIFVQNTYIITAASALVSILFYFLLLRNKKENLNERCSFKKIELKDSLYTIILGLSISALATSFILLTQNIFKSYQDTENLINSNLHSLSGIVSAIILLPIFEEILFRGLIFNELKNNINLIISIIIQATIFAIIHFNIAQAIYTFVLGILASLVYIWTKSIISNILLHITFNLSGSFIFPYLLNGTGKYVVIYIIPGLMFSIFSIVMLYRNQLNKYKTTYI